LDGKVPILLWTGIAGEQKIVVNRRSDRLPAGWLRKSSTQSPVFRGIAVQRSCRAARSRWI